MQQHCRDANLLPLHLFGFVSSFAAHQLVFFWSSQSGAGVSGGGGVDGGGGVGGGAVGGTTSVHVPHVNWQRVVFQVSESQRDGLWEIFFSHHSWSL